MRRLAMLAVSAVLLTGCQRYASSPVVGFGGFLGDTHLLRSNPNGPPGTVENLRRAEGQEVAVEPLLPESGNIWPGPPKAEPTLEDIISQEQPDGSAGGASGAAAGGGSAAGGATPDRQRLRALPTQSGAAPGTPGAAPAGGTNSGGGTGPGSIVVPNGNGTSTVIGPDGTTKTIPTPK